MNNPNFLVSGPAVVFEAAALFYSSAKIGRRFENRLRGKDGDSIPLRERCFRVCGTGFLAVAVAFGAVGFLLLWLGLK
jgi:hypothetical protein